MAKPILMPQVGQDLTEGKLVELKVKTGDTVAKGDIVAVVESEKASFEVEAFEAGIVIHLPYEEGDTTTVLEPLMYLGDEGETISLNGADTTATPATAEPEQSVQAPRNKVSSSPLARRLAQQNGIDITTLVGTGPKQSIVRRDIDKAIAGASKNTPPTQPTPAPQPAPLPSSLKEDREEPFDRMRQVIADRLTLSKQTIPHFYLRAEIDVTDLVIRRRAAIESGADKASINDLLIQITALALREFPRLNAHVAADRVILKSQVNIGVAVSVENGLMVPVIANTDEKSVGEIGTMVRDYAAAARRGVSKSTALGTFSISNLGMFGVEVFPIINPPEAGILGVGPIARQVREHRGGIHVREIMTVMLAADHRAVDGVYGAQFLARLSASLESYTFT